MIFVKLTLLSGEEIRINFDKVEYYGVVTDKTYDNVKEEYIGKTFIYPNACVAENLYIVQEAVEEIDEIFNLIQKKNGKWKAY